VFNRQRTVSQPQCLPLSLFFLKFANLIIANNLSFSFLRFTVSFLQNRGSPTILTVKTWQYLLKYGRGVRFVFVVISLLHCSFGNH
jgi:hypothetical protein